MENLLQTLLTDKAARKPATAEKLALNQSVMEPWATETSM